MGTATLATTARRAALCASNRLGLFASIRLGLGAAILGLTQAPMALADGGTPKVPAAPLSQPAFGVLRNSSTEEAKKQSREWLNRKGAWNAGVEKRFEELWSRDVPLSDKVADSFGLGDRAIAAMLTSARDAYGLPPESMPALFKDGTQSIYLRANLAVAYARALSLRRIHEDALESLNLFQPEQVADPATYLYHRAVSEHALMLKEEALNSLDRLLQDVPELPERYRMLGLLLAYDLSTWRDKDLAWISRKMEILQRRLEVSRGGKKTQKIQKEVVARLDEMIKDLENQQKESSSSNGGNCPNGAPQQGNPGNSTQPTNPAKDSAPGGPQGQGGVDSKRVKELAEVWGKLPEKDRARALVELTRNAPTKYKEAIELYFKKLSQTSPAPVPAAP